MKKIFVSIIATVSLLGSVDLYSVDAGVREQKSDRSSCAKAPADGGKRLESVDAAALCMTLMDVAALLTVAPAVYMAVASQMESITRWPYFSMGVGFGTSIVAASACSECGKLLLLPFLGENWQRAKAENRRLQKDILGYAIIAAFIGFIISR